MEFFNIYIYICLARAKWNNPYYFYFKIQVHATELDVNDWSDQKAKYRQRSPRIVSLPVADDGVTNGASV